MMTSRNPGRGRGRNWAVAIGVWAWATWAGAQGSIYEVPEVPGEVVGAWDVNILADDVHFETAAILRMVRLRLAIAGEQECKVWIFDSMGSPALHVQGFTNVPATNQFDVSTYDVEMRVQVPKDIYVGFSAQGDGWNATDSDFWSRGNVVNRGVAGTAGQYYYGLVEGGQLTTMYPADAVSHGCIQILSEPVRMEGVAVSSGQVQVAVSSLPIHATNRMQRAVVAETPAWEDVGVVAPGEEMGTWSADAGAERGALYRVESR
jgi:hypothetical protein